jgi:hypothetical protein
MALAVCVQNASVAAAPTAFPGNAYFVMSSKTLPQMFPANWIGLTVVAGRCSSPASSMLRRVGAVHQHLPVPAAAFACAIVRQEVEALEVLGVDTIRTLAVPRMVAVTTANGLPGVVLAILVQLVDLVCMLLLDAVTMVSAITPVSAVGHVWSKIVLESNVRFRIS